MTAHPIQWHAPKPLWGRFGATPQAAAAAPDQFRPAILRFASDDFMDQVIGTLGRDPARLGDFLARPETWRTPSGAAPDLIERVVVPASVQNTVRTRALARPGSRLDPVATTAAVTEKSQLRQLPLKLYQAAHMRHYLVSASLVCGVAGLPERAPTPGGSEQVNFILRRLLPLSAANGGDSSLREFAFVKDADGARWRMVTAGDDAAQMAPGEELLPLFPLTYRDELGHMRTLWTGVVPVGRREEYFGATVDRAPVALTDGQLQSLQPVRPAPPAASVTARMTQFKLEVAEPWKNLVRAAYMAQASINAQPPPSADKAAAQLLALNLQWQQQSWLILLDFADYIAAYLPDVWTAITGDPGAGPLSPQRQKLLDWLGTPTMSGSLVAAMQWTDPNTQTIVSKPAWPSLRDALKAIRTTQWRSGLEQATQLYGTATAAGNSWPDHHFLLVGVDANTSVAGAIAALYNLTAPTPADGVEADASAVPPPSGEDAASQIDSLTALVVRALDPRPETDAPPLPFALQLRDALADTIGDTGTFVLRCVYLNRDCGPLHPPTLSAPTQRFQLANFFDPDAPARPVRITLPLDTTPAGLRKHAKNTAFVISDVLCGQIQRAKGLGFGDLVLSVLPWPFHKDLGGGDTGPCQSGGINIGMICSLSIPIITICALILLFIFVLLFDLVFRWLPFFVLCFPVRKFKAKNGGSS